jgi:hypothetical protein
VLTAASVSRTGCHIPLERHGLLFATAAFFLPAPIAPNPNKRFKSHAPISSKKHSVGSSMTMREKLNLAGLAFGLTATFAWIGLLGFGLSEAIRWLL